jgi:hypothetical protein
MKCRFEHDGDCCNSGATQYMCKCKQPCDTIVPMTNADRIRAMSDEELRDFLFNKVSVDSICNFCVPKMRTERKCDGHCRNGILEWLKQPAEVGA